jgi:asparagine synthase (glutamine-hydrolysing)
MCGIAGFVSTDGLDSDASARATAMREVIAHRGPDEAGLHVDSHAALAHRRLSIIDLTSGQQPLSNETGTIWIVFNGEIYNHAVIRQELEGHGHQYRTKSDTETIVHAYEQWGDACVDRLRGMFAFAIWDSSSRRLLLTRDRLGVKPLYWARVGKTLLFGSEIKALLASGLIEPEPDEAALPELLGTRYISGSRTLFRNIQKLLPGHQLVFHEGTIRTRQYWDIPVGRRHPISDLKDAPRRFRELLEESIRLRLMSDVPLGVFLSGGLDSSAIAALMSRLVDRPIKTFSVAFEDQAYNELEYARQTAQAVNADAHELVINDHDFFSALPGLVWHEDEPIAHPSSVPLYFVSELARHHVTVVLTGEGSDELLAGYGKYPRITWNWRAGTIYERLIPGPVRHAISRHLVSRVPGRVGRLARRSFLNMDRTADAMCFDNFAAVRLKDQQRLLSPFQLATFRSSQAYAASTAYFDHPKDQSTLLDRVLYADMKTYLVELLMKQDQMSMAASIESRVPFLDHKLVEFAAGLPDEWKLSGWIGKRILREAMKGVIPEPILTRPKLGFPVPFGSWVRDGWGDVVRDVLLDRRTRERGVLNIAAVDLLLREHRDGLVAGGARIWTLMNLELWYRTFIDKQGVQTLPAPSRDLPAASSIPQAMADVVQST